MNNNETATPQPQTIIYAEWTHLDGTKCRLIDKPSGGKYLLMTEVYLFGSWDSCPYSLRDDALRSYFTAVKELTGK